MAMMDADKVSLTCALLGIEEGSADAAPVEAYLSLAQTYVLDARHPFSASPADEEWEPRYDALQCEIAAALMSRRGAEGEVVHTENGVSREWASASPVPAHLLQRIVPLGKAVSAR